MTTHIVGSCVHLSTSYGCGDATGQNMVTLATQKACDKLMESLRGSKYKVKHFIIEGQLFSDKKPSWGNVKRRRGAEVIVWDVLSNEVCQSTLGCTSARLYTMCKVWKEWGTRNGQFGDNGNMANIIAAIFIATDQDAGSIS